MYLYTGGCDVNNRLGIAPTTKNNGGGYCVDSATRVPFDLESVQCVSGGSEHSVIIKLGSVYAVGDSDCFGVYNKHIKNYKEFSKFKIINEQISWAACGSSFTLYLTESGNVILCHISLRGSQIHVNLAKKAVSVFAGCFYGGIIDEEGAIHILDKKDPSKLPQRFYLGMPAIDLVCCFSFTCALALDGRVFLKDTTEFAEVQELKGIKIEKLSGFNDTCAALTSDGRVFIYGDNYSGQCGDGKSSNCFQPFAQVILNEEIKDVACSRHTIFLTKSNKIFGCGSNDSYQLLKKTEEEKVLSPIHVATIEADQVIVGDSYTFILSGTGKLENPAKVFFLGMKKHTNNDIINKMPGVPLEEPKKQVYDLNEKIDSLIEMNKSQTKIISKLMEMCQNLQQQSELSKREINKMHELHQREIHEMKEEIRRQEQKTNDLKNLNEEMNKKLDLVVQYINDQDIY